LPLSTKLGGGTSKRLLRSVLGRYVPHHLFERPKNGFNMPVGDWLRGPLREWAESLLSESRLRADGILDVAAVRGAWLEHVNGRRDMQLPLWTVLMLQAWFDETRGGFA
jgi:asparagine synthase (glutamine-hydrolysing)